MALQNVLTFPSKNTLSINLTAGGNKMKDPASRYAPLKNYCLSQHQIWAS